MTSAASAAALTDDEWSALWGDPLDLSGHRLPTRAERRAEFRLAQHAQQLRAEEHAGDYREETAAFYGSPRYAQAEHVERRLVLADVDREHRLEVEAGREWPLVHGTAAAHKVCAPPGEPRCPACRAYQTSRSTRNRADRRARAWCTGTRSSYDAGCRCPSCSAANAAGCRSYRQRAVP